MFKVGDRVVAFKNVDYNVKKDYAGRVIGVKNHANEICVEFDNDIGGHSGNHPDIHGKEGHCWWCNADKFKLEEREFKVGDRVQFKSLEEIEILRKTTGIEYGWCSEMDELCETFATITGINGKEIFLKDFTATCKIDWTYSTDMIKLADEQPEKPKKEKKIKIDSQSKLSADERKILYSLNKTYIARDIDGRLFVYQERPVIDIGGKQFYSDKPYKEILQRELFDFIKFKNSPISIEDLIKEG